jgi:hypothetical protein
MTSAGRTSSWRSARSSAVRSSETGWGVAPHFQMAAQATIISTVLGRATVTMESWPTPRAR